MPSLSARRIIEGANVPSGQSACASFLSSGVARSWSIRESIAAASRLFAAVMAWMSPVR